MIAVNHEGFDFHGHHKKESLVHYRADQRNVHRCISDDPFDRYIFEI